jgi:hypothetical protein
MASNNYWASGQWNFICELCGAKRKSKDGVKTWDGHYVCSSHKEVRNPQDFVRGVRENLTVPWTRPATVDTFIPTCTVIGSLPVPACATPGCAIPGPMGHAWAGEISSSCQLDSIKAIPSVSIPGCAIPAVFSYSVDFPISGITLY